MAENNVSNDYTNLKLIHTSRYGNSRVFTANNNGKKVIVKALKQEYADDPACREKLRQEYDTTSILDNKYIRKALDFVQIEGMGDCIIFEYIEGKSLAEHVRVGTLSEKQVKSVLTEICEALYFLHRNGIVHCNLNPDNIIVTAADCHVKLIDIGIPETKQDADRELLIKEMEFIAPEIIKDEDYDSRADVYSIGKIMEFIGERNISRQFGSVATHCTQFSKETAGRPGAGDQGCTAPLVSAPPGFAFLTASLTASPHDFLNPDISSTRSNRKVMSWLILK